jgi:hypothetical protein
LGLPFVVVVGAAAAALQEQQTPPPLAVMVVMVVVVMGWKGKKTEGSSIATAWEGNKCAYVTFFATLVLTVPA